MSTSLASTRPVAATNPPARTRRRSHLALVILTAALVLGAGACRFSPPQLRANPRFESCSIGYYDETGSMRSYLDEVGSFTGMRFTPVTKRKATASGLLIVELRGGTATTEGVTTSWWSTIRHPGASTTTFAQVEIRVGASPGIRRHELGHLFDLSHNPSSKLMRPIPDPRATYSVLERMTMRDMARRSGCTPPSFA